MRSLLKIMGVVILLFTLAACHTTVFVRPERPCCPPPRCCKPHYAVWVPGHWGPCGRWIPGHWVVR